MTRKLTIRLGYPIKQTTNGIFNYRLGCCSSVLCHGAAAWFSLISASSFLPLSWWFIAQLMLSWWWFFSDYFMMFVVIIRCVVDGVLMTGLSLDDDKIICCFVCCIYVWVADRNLYLALCKYEHIHVWIIIMIGNSSNVDILYCLFDK